MGERFEKVVTLSLADLRGEGSTENAPRRLNCTCDSYTLSSMGPNEMWGYEKDCPSHGHLR